MPLPAFLNSYFLSPYGLLAALGLVPLILFYLMKPEPEEQVMPSLAFFMKKQRSGKANQALHRLIMNLLLIFHILMVLGFAAAAAEPYVTADQKPQETVVVLDRSASMSNDVDEARKFVRQNLGAENTVVVAGEDVEVPMEKASSLRVRNYLRSYSTRDVETDIASAVEIASDYSGRVVVASDLDQTVNDRDPVETLRDLRQGGRDIQVMDTDNSNSWGIIRVEPGRNTASVDIKNFMDREAGITVDINGESRQHSVKAGSVKTVTFTPERSNTVELEPDSMEADNRAYISVPGRKNFEVVLVSDSGNPFLEKALELIEFTSVETATPPLETVPEADAYIIGRTDRLLQTTVKQVEEETGNGAGLVVFSQPGLQDRNLESLPVRLKGGARNRSVEIEQPVRTSIGDTKVFRASKTRGESLSTPGAAMVRSGYGRGEVLFYNIKDSDFNREFMYPVFWKRVLDSLLDRPALDELNRDTGSRINGSRIETPAGERRDGEITLDEAGFYNSSNLYAANLASEDESATEDVKFETRTVEATTEKNLQKVSAVLLALLASLELLYLIYSGDL